jgi:hypothetical protein
MCISMTRRSRPPVITATAIGTSPHPGR